VRIALLLELLFVLAIAFSPGTLIDRKQMARAVVEDMKHSTPETKAEIKRQRRITLFEELGCSVFLFLILATPTLLVAYARPRRLCAPTV